MVNNPGFFKFYIPSLGEENMKIPRRFFQSFQETLPTNLTLRDCYNNLWQVNVEMVEGNLYFKDGWTKFAEDNMIEGGDVLAYEYSSRGLLDFKVHGRSTCSTKGVGGHRTKNYYEGEQVIDDDDHSVPSSEEENQSIEFFEEKITDVDDSDDDDYSPTTEEENDHDDYSEVEKVMDVTDNDEDDYVPAPDEEEIQRDGYHGIYRVIDVTDVNDEDNYDPTTDEEEIQHDGYHGIDRVIDVTYGSDDDDSFPTTEEGNQQDDYEVMDGKDDDYLPTTTEEKQREADLNGNEAINVDGHDINCKCEPTTEDVNHERTQEEVRTDGFIPGVQVRDDGGPSTSKRKSTRDFDWYGVEIFQSGLVRQPNNPYFVTKIRKQRAYELYVPRDVIKSYGLQLPDTILLIDPRGREFRATRKIWSDGRTFYTGGWRRLCGMNQVKDDDSCICEFVQRGQDLCIHVSFFPPKQ